MRFRRVLTIAILSILLPTTAAVYEASAKDALRLPIYFEAPDACRISVGDRSFSMPHDQDAFLASLQPLAAGARRLSIVGGAGIPYRCIGQAIFIAQLAGFAKAGFIADPPSDE